MKKKQTAEDLEYIAFVVRRFCNLYGSGLEELVEENALDLFLHRKDNIDCISKYDLYKSTGILQEKIKKYDYDSYKFWLLLLFLKDYSESCFGDSYIFDNVSIGDNIKKMLEMLDASPCDLTISNDIESAHISTLFIKNELKKLLSSYLHCESSNLYPYTGLRTDNVLWHKIKFFMEMLDYFLECYSPSYTKISVRKDWKFIAQILYIVGYLKEKKYLTGYEEIQRKHKTLDGGITYKSEKAIVKGVGKFIKDNTKCCKAIPNRSQYNVVVPYSQLRDAGVTLLI